ncbi:hypothetical protein KZX50_14445 [Bacillus infantis]|uniref:hypothetical protein n=1 Tax=Bacillus infantis TaxID=324767 RepID=UPI000B9A72DD|nr:hypothetical protein [Bacillus infantis]MCK6206641.1 hypothetical protein [Bacillus infantis]OXT16075.1 hypothetical protein B9K06_18060 [Bacillus sp. OG2]
MFKKSLISFSIFFMIAINLCLWPYLLKETGLIDSLPFKKEPVSAKTESTGEHNPKGKAAAGEEAADTEAKAESGIGSTVKEGSPASASEFEVVDIK